MNYTRIDLPDSMSETVAIDGGFDPRRSVARYIDVARTYSAFEPLPASNTYENFNESSASILSSRPDEPLLPL